MVWTKPDYEEVSLSGEVTAYVNTSVGSEPRPADIQPPQKGPATDE